jgi:hypothetical protein
MRACIETKVNYKKHKYTYVKSQDNSPEGSESAQQGRLLPATRNHRYPFTTLQNTTVETTKDEISEMNLEPHSHLFTFYKS